MRRYLLDTAPVAACLQGRPGAFDLIRPWLAQHEAATSIVVYAEVTEFLQGFPDATNRQDARRTLLREIPPYLLTYTIMERYAEIRRELRPPHGEGL